MGWFGGTAQCYRDGCIVKGRCPWIFNLTINGNICNLKIARATGLYSFRDD